MHSSNVVCTICEIFFLNQQTQTWHGMSYNSIKECTRASDVTYSCRILLLVPFTYQTLTIFIHKSIYELCKIHYLHQVEKFKNMKWNYLRTSYLFIWFCFIFNLRKTSHENIYRRIVTQYQQIDSSLESVNHNIPQISF